MVSYSSIHVSQIIQGSLVQKNSRRTLNQLDHKEKSVYDPVTRLFFFTFKAVCRVTYIELVCHSLLLLLSYFSDRPFDNFVLKFNQKAI